jgi:hypothetical protein
LSALVLLRKPLFGLAKRRQQPERYVQFALKFIEKIENLPEKCLTKALDGYKNKVAIKIAKEYLK